MTKRVSLVVVAFVAVSVRVFLPGISFNYYWNDFGHKMLDPDAPDPPSRGHQLSVDAIHEYNDKGFVVVRGVYTQTEIDNLKPILNEQLDNFGFVDHLINCSRKLHGELYRNTWTWRFWQGGPIADIASQLLGNGSLPIMLTSEILEMRAGKTCIPGWHWDYLPFPMNLYCSDGMQAWLSTEHVNATVGGGLAFLPRSHHLDISDPCNPKVRVCFICFLLYVFFYMFSFICFAHTHNTYLHFYRMYSTLPINCPRTATINSNSAW
jgi:hypothetical protein